MDLVSVIVPVYKVEKYLDRCLNSIVNQSYKNIEIILIDDGSPDNCPELCDEWAKKHEFIKVIHKKNGGLSSARNAGLKIAKGKFVCFVDSDDFIKRDFIKDFVISLNKDDSDIAICSFKRITSYEIDDVKNDIKLDSSVITGYEGIRRLLNYNSNEFVTNHMTIKFFKKELFEGLSFLEGRNFEDVGICYLLFERAKRISLINKDNYYYFKHPGSITCEMSLKSLEDKFYVGEQRNNYLIKKYPEFELFNKKYNINNYLFILKELIKKFGKDVDKYDLFSSVKSKYLSIRDWNILSFKEKIVDFTIKSNNKFLYSILKKIIKFC